MVLIAEGREVRKSKPVGAAPPTLFASIMADLQRVLYAFVRGLIGDDEHARDIVQDVFVDAWRAIRQGTPPFTDNDDTAIRRWLFHAAYCDAASILRRRRLIRWESLDAPVRTKREYEYSSHQTSFEDQVIERTVMQDALSTLDPADAACLLLNVLQGFTAVEIAAIVGISPEAGKKRLSRAKQRLRAAYLANSHRDPAYWCEEPKP
ncbi:MAG TPA: sigma-70 family RNA polymerase sigma factor [Ktedonobacterales bacterium]|nr:sigma-70 family RNA polymerase sigma factor [Ktedonobacterales bacterium]